MGGNVTMDFVDGIATFDNIYLDQAGEGYSLQFAVSYPTNTLSPVDSNAFDVARRPLGLKVLTPISLVAEKTPFKLFSKIWDDALDSAADASVLSSYSWDCVASLTNGSLSGTTSITVAPGDNIVKFDDLKIDQTGMNQVVNIDCSTTDATVFVSTMTPPFHVHVFPETGMLKQTITTFKFDGSLTKIEGIIKNFKNYMGTLSCKGCPNRRMDGDLESSVDPSSQLDMCSSPLVKC